MPRTARRLANHQARRTKLAPVKPVPRAWPWAECAGWLVLAGLSVFFLVASWRKWPSPLVDFGHQLYAPWRLTQGAVLYRDVDNSYGPLSQYLHAGLFYLFGPGMMVLVAANLAVFAAILVLTYLLFRRAWGTLAAFTAASAFVVVFAFSQYVTMGNSTYAAPYAHEATHGILVCLLLILGLSCWTESPARLSSFLAGLLAGLTAVLKPEFMLAAASGIVAAAAAAWRFQRLPRLQNLILAGAGAGLPTLGFTLFFAIHQPWGQALSFACRAWWIPGGVERFTDQALQQRMLGLDRPWVHLEEHALATLLALALVAASAGAAWWAERSAGGWHRFLPAGVLAAGLLYLSSSVINWLNIGQCLLGLAIVYIVAAGAAVIRAPRSAKNSGVLALRLTIAVVAATLMARMVLNGRIYQYGFYQAALAGILIPAVWIGELPARMGGGARRRAVVIVTAAALIVPGMIRLAGHSLGMFRAATFAVGDGLDRFYTLPPEVEPAGAFVGSLTDYLGKNAKKNDTLLVLPEGEMINYLARMPSPVAHFFFYGASTSGNGEQSIVAALDRHPPDWVALVSLDLREHGIERWGSAPGRGQEILRWLHEHYVGEASIGGDPFDVRQRGAVLLRHKSAANPPAL